MNNNFVVRPLEKAYGMKAKERLDSLIKPEGSLGILEQTVIRYAEIKGTAKPEDLACKKRALMVFGTPTVMNRVERFMREDAPLFQVAKKLGVQVYANVLLADTAEEALIEGSLLTQEYLNEGKFDAIGFGILDRDNFTLHGVAGAMLQAASQRVAFVPDCCETNAALAIAKEYEPSVTDYCLPLQDVLQLNLSNETGIIAVLNLNLLVAGLRCYNEMLTFEEAGVNRPV